MTVNIRDQIRDFPTKRIHPVDGMAVSAPVWEEAHGFHRQQQRFHALFGHGPGILAGLNVIASDPPDVSVYVLPGAAIDANGYSISLAEPLNYDLGQAAEGMVHLLISYEEGQPRALESQGQEAPPLYVQTGYTVEARATLPDTPYVELARLWHENRQAPIHDAQNPAHPGLNEIDQRFRNELAVIRPQIAHIGVWYPGTAALRHGRGAQNLALALSRADSRRVWVDEGIQADRLSAYSLVMVAAQGGFQLTAEEAQALLAYAQNGGTVLFESCRHDTPGETPASDAAFTDLLSAAGLKLADLTPGQPLLTEPNLFASLPPGFEARGTVRVGGGFVFSTQDYGCVWQGERRSGPASREEIRSALEWGENLLTYALKRRAQASAAGPQA
jgi:hypothetical protein